MSTSPRPFAAFDIDGTIFRWQLYHELFDALATAGYIDKANYDTVTEAREAWSKRQQSFSDYETLLVSVMERKVIGLPERTVKQLARDILGTKGHRTYTYTRNLMQSLREQGYVIIAISGSYQQLVEEFAKLHQIDLAIGTEYELENGNFLHKKRYVFGQKGPILTKAVEEHNLSWEDSYAIGDSGSDSAMLELVTHPIAFNPDDRLFQQAKASGWKVVLERKNMIYELEETDGTYLLAATNHD
ncbi:HAD-IB family hydrolase [Candidatus Saccharibacteria bacterium]|nr:MAG: HAD-IB family hydrolase [Candidatus Saccharibacteria bacterium]